MAVCIVCRFEITTDDVAVATATGRHICIRCFARETGSARTVPSELRRELDAVLARVAAV